MKNLTTDPVAEPAAVLFKRCTVDLQSGATALEDVPCLNLEEVQRRVSAVFEPELETLSLGSIIC